MTSLSENRGNDGLGPLVPGVSVSTSLAHRILQSFRMRHAGATSVATYFVARGFGARAAVDQALARLARSGDLQRVDRGVYQLPRRHPQFGVLAARTADVVDAVRRSQGSTTVKVQPDGAFAANQLGLSTQVPMQAMWLTSGRGRTTRIGRQVLRFVHDTSLPVSLLGTTAGQVIVALRWLGPDGASPQDLQRLGRQLSDADKGRLARVGPRQPVWMRAAIGQLAHGG